MIPKSQWNIYPISQSQKNIERVTPDNSSASVSLGIKSFTWPIQTCNGTRPWKLAFFLGGKCCWMGKRKWWRLWLTVIGNWCFFSTIPSIPRDEKWGCEWSFIPSLRRSKNISWILVGDWWAFMGIGEWRCQLSKYAKNCEEPCGNKPTLTTNTAILYHLDHHS